MLEIKYTAQPFYSNVGGINDPCTKNLVLQFDDEASSLEIIAQLVKVLEFMGYSKQTKSMWLDFVDAMAWDGVLIDDLKESQEN